MRDLGITVLVALLIVFAGIRFSGYQKQLLGTISETAGSAVALEAADIVSASSTSVLEKSEKNIPDKEPVLDLDLSISSTAALQVADQKAGASVSILSVVVPEGSYWVAVREDTGTTSRTLGARLFAKGNSHGVVHLLRPTQSANTYHVLLHKDNGDRKYVRAEDTEVKDIDGKVVGVTIKAL